MKLRFGAAASYRFVCSGCGKVHAWSDSEYTCTRCGPAGILEPVGLHVETASSLPVTDSPGMWRYERLLALSPDALRSPLLVGNTPLLEANRLGETLLVPRLYIKNDSVNPTGSLKDRASAVVLARAAEIGSRKVAVASTGNAG